MGKFLVILVGDLQRRDHLNTDLLETQCGGAVTTIEAAL